MFVCKIHNNSLGRCVQVNSWEQAVKQIKDWCDESDFVLTKDDLVSIEETGEYYNDDDSDNIVTYSVGVFDDV
jgi:mannitol/fructose-specific phosphotransferase system IIA component (Ntr-type)